MLGFCAFGLIKGAGANLRRGASKKRYDRRHLAVRTKKEPCPKSILRAAGACSAARHLACSGEPCFGGSNLPAVGRHRARRIAPKASSTTSAIAAFSSAGSEIAGRGVAPERQVGASTPSRAGRG